jgi:hypothetical protein
MQLAPVTDKQSFKAYWEGGFWHRIPEERWFREKQPSTFKDLHGLVMEKFKYPFFRGNFFIHHNSLRFCFKMIKNTYYSRDENLVTTFSIFRNIAYSFKIWTKTRQTLHFYKFWAYFWP